MTEFTLPMPRTRKRRAPLMKALITQRDVIWALILHDIKSRFFGNGLGYVVTILWPSVHIAIIVAIYVFGKRPVPYGSSAFLYACIGILPYITWSYMSRFTMIGMMQNRNFLAYPVIKPLDMMIARLILETITSFIITVGLVCVTEMLGVDSMPLHLSEAIFGILSAVLLGAGFGVFNAVIVMMFPLWIIGYVGIIILFWITAGMAFNPETMPAELAYYMSWNPLMHSIEWIRSAYYADFPAHLLSKSYAISVGAGALALGLVMERTLRKFFK